MDRVIGRCSICGGNVTFPDVWLGITPPKPVCIGCGATRIKDDLPTIPMRKHDPLGPFVWQINNDEGK